MNDRDGVVGSQIHREKEEEDGEMLDRSKINGREGEAISGYIQKVEGKGFGYEGGAMDGALLSRGHANRWNFRSNGEAVAILFSSFDKSGSPTFSSTAWKRWNCPDPASVLLKFIYFSPYETGLTRHSVRPIISGSNPSPVLSSYYHFVKFDIMAYMSRNKSKSMIQNNY